MPINPADPLGRTEDVWRRQRRLVREGFKDLEYLPRGRTRWNATLAALAHSARRASGERADLNLWAAMHGVAPSGRYEHLGPDGLVLWHGTSAERAKKIRQVGLMHKRGVWAAAEPRIAHSFTRGRSERFQAGSAMIVLLISKNAWEGRATRETDTIVRFHANVPRECVEYVCWPDRIEFCGLRRASGPKPWAVARFARREGRWAPRSRPPVRFDAQTAYRTLDEWLALSVGRVLATLGAAAAIEVFSSLYATIDPWAALEHEAIFNALASLGVAARPGRGGKRFRQPDPTGRDRRPRRGKAR